MAEKPNPIVFIHGLWLHATSWEPWEQLFGGRGYSTLAPGWPGDKETVAATRDDPDSVANIGIDDVAVAYSSIIEELPASPILIGHSFGGLMVQNLLGRDLAAAAVAIDPGPIKGVSELPASALKSGFPVLGNPFNYRRAVSLTEGQFRFGFTNAVSEQEAHELYAKYAMPGPGRPLFQVATAMFNPNSANKVNAANPTRGPLLLISGEQDHIVPPVLVKSTLRVYSQSPAVTEIKSFAGRGHSLTIDSGWREIAEYCLAWLKGKGL